MSISQEIEKLKKELPETVKLIAVSKTKSAEQILEAYYSGHKIFGENKVQELAGKYEILPKDIEWHMVGHLQTNKVKYIVPFVSIIHAVDSLKLMIEINKQALKHHRIIDCLLQLKIAREESKFGLNFSEVKLILESDEYHKLNNIRILGVMGMASFTDNTSTIRDEFKELVRIFKSIRQDYFAGMPEFKELSMGMSTDYKIAIEEGSTMVRIGSQIFGKRVYCNLKIR
ncbi:MAG: YggS family pyridoxal phosphate-dependent enzyme [Bacteroidales bacterium]|nr:YggS family pyridoxal phosphate-dependent enzyme [Bacteroidales bacterium]